MTLSDKIYFVLGIICGMQDDYVKIFGVLVKQSGEVMKAYNPATLVDVTTVFESAHPDLLAKIYNIENNSATAPLSSEEQDKLTDLMEGGGDWPERFATYTAPEIMTMLSEKPGLVDEWLVTRMLIDLGATCPQKLLSWKAKVIASGVGDLLTDELGS